MKIGKIIRIASRIVKPLLVAVHGIIEALDDGIITPDEAASIAGETLEAAGYLGRLSDDTIEHVVMAAVSLVQDLIEDSAPVQTIALPKTLPGRTLQALREQGGLPPHHGGRAE